MNPKAVNTAKTAPQPVSQKDKDAAKQCLILADKFLKDGDFEKSRSEVAKAQKLDPSNPYAYAFLDRIAYFQEQRRKEGQGALADVAKKNAAEAEASVKEEAGKKAAAETARLKEEEEKKKAAERERLAASIQKIEETRRRSEEQKRKAEEDAKKKTEATAPEDQSRASAESAKRPVIEEALERARQEVARREEERSRQEAAKAAAAKAATDATVQATRPVIAEVLAARAAEQPQPPAPPIGQVLEMVPHHAPSTSKGDVDVKLDEMRRQIEMLTKALDQERKVREEMNQQQLQGAVKQLRTSMEKAWINGAPDDKEIHALHNLAASLGVPEDVVQTLQREVKLDMYSRAVKEVVAKQKLVRSSSKTLEWLRKVYQVTLDEYLEYESKFLLDLVADQYKGTILFVSSDDRNVRDLGVRLKSVGYAVVPAVSPENALEKIEKLTPHYILCDMEFSQGFLSGIKFLHVLRANTKFNYIPFILMCEPNEVSQLQKSELRPTEGYVEKPVDFERLNAVMSEKLVAFRTYLSSI